MFAALTEGIAVRDPDGEIVYANPSMLQKLGFSSVEEARASSSSETFANFIVLDEHGNLLDHDDLAGVRLARNQQGVETLLMQMIRRDTGDLIWWQITATPLNAKDGTFLGAIVVTDDVTAARTSELRLQVLAESGRILASSLDYEQTLRNVAEVAVLLADYCSVDLIGERQTLRRVTAAHRLESRRDLTQRLGSLAPVVLEDDHPVMRVLRTSEPQLYPMMDDDAIAAMARDPEHLTLLRALGLRSMLVVPLRVPSRTIGVMTIATDASRRQLDGDDVDLAAQLGRRAAVVVENSRLHTKLSGIAETLQEGLLPAPLPNIPGWEVASLYQPAATEFRVDVGGDFYEIFETIDRQWFALLGDVAGKGVSAASTTLLARHGARVAARTEPEPVAILRRLDEALGAQPGRAMATAVCMHIDADSLTVSAGGHPPLVLIKPDGTLRTFPLADPMLGAFSDIERHQETVNVDYGDLIVAYTDGLPEAAGPQGRFGEQRLMEVLSQAAAATPQQVLDRITLAMAEFAADSTGDDVAALVLRRAAP
jgi:PAS domain S-box-containing protein